jgi:hypothetical protein
VRYSKMGATFADRPSLQADFNRSYLRDWGSGSCSIHQNIAVLWS